MFKLSFLITFFIIVSCSTEEKERKQKEEQAPLNTLQERLAKNNISTIEVTLEDYFFKKPKKFRVYKEELYPSGLSKKIVDTKYYGQWMSGYEEEHHYDENGFIRSFSYEKKKEDQSRNLFFLLLQRVQEMHTIVINIG